MSLINKNYNNFVRPSSSKENTKSSLPSAITGYEAKKLYLEEVEEGQKEVNFKHLSKHSTTIRKSHDKPQNILQVSDRELFLIVQNNDINTLKDVLNSFPDKIRVVDEYGWSLLMSACQANSVEVVKELLRRGSNLSIRDRAGNSARSLVIKNKNLALADLFLNYESNENLDIKPKKYSKMKKEEYKCEICDNNVFLDKYEHLSSTIHNLNASKGRKIPANYVIPSSNKGYQIMLKAGWDKESGLGPDGSGKRYPIKPVQKKDRKGLGNKKRKVEEEKEVTARHKHRRELNKNYHDNRKIEINFRRQFY